MLNQSDRLENQLGTCVWFFTLQPFPFQSEMQLSEEASFEGQYSQFREGIFNLMAQGGQAKGRVLEGKKRLKLNHFFQV